MREHVTNPNIHTNAPATSEVPAAEPAPLAEFVVPHPDAQAGGLDNIPEETLTVGQQFEDEVDHAGLDQQLPGEDQARPTDEQESELAKGITHAKR
jgi:hypothetical protein